MKQEVKAVCGIMIYEGEDPPEQDRHTKWKDLAEAMTFGQFVILSRKDGRNFATVLRQRGFSTRQHVDKTSDTVKIWKMKSMKQLAQEK